MWMSSKVWIDLFLQPESCNCASYGNEQFSIKDNSAPKKLYTNLMQQLRKFNSQHLTSYGTCDLDICVELSGRFSALFLGKLV